MYERMRAIATHLRFIYLGNRFFVGLGLVVVLSAAGFWKPLAFWLAVATLAVLLILTVVDTVMLYGRSGRVSAVRRPPEVFSLGDEMQVLLLIHNEGTANLDLTITDELPAELQVRDHRIQLMLPAGQKRTVGYGVRPLSRGRYDFGNLNLFVRSKLGLVERRREISHGQSVAVYPSIIQMKRFSLGHRASVPSEGRRRPRPVSRSYAFDSIKEYVRGDDLRSVNWKATARKGEVMVNQYETERAQRIYSVIDKGRTMLMPFNGLSLLDYAINASLALTNVILQRGDRAGLLTFSDKLGDILPADNRSDQLRTVLDTLYRQREREGESDYELLYYASRRFLPGRSLLLLFTNFESNYALDRVLPALRRIGRDHTLVVVLFENTEVTQLLRTPTSDVKTVYQKHTVRRYLQERQLMAARLRQNGVQVIFTRPEALTGQVIEKYLELKGRAQI
ncbi:uncharacterized protein (DUF58 family) [Lewinella aquimaris]|uniref:Uncharacterized protein (DUF58 family) n=1 Tax=Neolewinella aquimaris TaxID=1835722 RepID=A0A840EH02_9BACT|nr:DUF58 domain-containing protein [Neolewinella aquimaris]MBB4080186.1 uncharacterized protein (DUF58 family) [Neolewinella aquimaris]